MSDKIQAYIDGDLPEDEKQAFEQELASDEALRAEVELYQKMKFAIRAEGMKSALESMHFETTATQDSHQSTDNFKKKNIKPWIWVAALSILAVLAWFLLKQEEKKQAEPEKKIPVHLQYAQDIKSLEGLPVTLSATTNNYDFNEGMVHYRRKDFAQAVTYFTRASENGISSDTLQIYLANALLATDRDEEAKVLLDYIAENQSGPYYETSLWYLTKYYLKRKNTEEAISSLEKLVGLEGQYAGQAEEMIVGLKE